MVPTIFYVVSPYSTGFTIFYVFHHTHNILSHIPYTAGSLYIHTSTAGSLRIRFNVFGISSVRPDCFPALPIWSMPVPTLESSVYDYGESNISLDP